MNTATISDVFDPRIHPIRRVDSLSRPANLSDGGICIGWQVREDKGFYIPDILSDEDREIGPAVYTATHEHSKYLRKAEMQLHHALNLVGQMREAIGDDCDARAMQAETLLRDIEKSCARFAGSWTSTTRPTPICFSRTSASGLNRRKAQSSFLLQHER